VQIAQNDFSGASLTCTGHWNTSILANDGCAPGMVIWVLASHNRRRAMIRVASATNPHREQKLPFAKSILRVEFAKLKRKPWRRREAWTGGTT
jgi:hypothetical protein